MAAVAAKLALERHGDNSAKRTLSAVIEEHADNSTKSALSSNLMDLEGLVMSGNGAGAESANGSETDGAAAAVVKQPTVQPSVVKSALHGGEPKDDSDKLFSDLDPLDSKELPPTFQLTNRKFHNLPSTSHLCPEP